jgi:hypothetical protein
MTQNMWMHKIVTFYSPLYITPFQKLPEISFMTNKSPTLNRYSGVPTKIQIAFIMEAQPTAQNILLSISE